MFPNQRVTLSSIIQFGRQAAKLTSKLGHLLHLSACCPITWALSNWVFAKLLVNIAQPGSQGSVLTVFGPHLIIGDVQSHLAHQLVLKSSLHLAYHFLPFFF